MATQMLDIARLLSPARSDSINIDEFRPLPVSLTIWFSDCKRILHIVLEDGLWWLPKVAPALW